ncbi:MAG TPA: hypothetical protein VGD14_09010, partial [bacterium]
ILKADYPFTLLPFYSPIVSKVTPPTVHWQSSIQTFHNSGREIKQLIQFIARMLLTSMLKKSQMKTLLYLTS